MYDTLTAHYAALFRVSSPLSINWAREKNFRLLGGSKRLRDAFYNLRSELFTFCEYGQRTLQFLAYSDYYTYELILFQTS
jgi:hypothetical protein